MATEKPPDAIKSEHKTDGGAVIYGNVSANRDFVGRDKVIQIGSLRIPRWVLLLVVSFLFVLVLAVLLITVFTGSIFFAVTEPTPTQLPPPTPTQFKMGVDSYNILVVPFRNINARSEAATDTQFEDISAIIVGFLQSDQTLLDQLSEITGQRIAIEQLPDDAYGLDVNNVAQIAKDVHAHVIIFGDMTRVSSDTWEINPRFYIPESERFVEGSMFGEYNLATSISYTQQNQSSRRDMTRTMRSIVTKLVIWLTGISVYEEYDHEHLCQAAWMFQQTLRPSQIEMDQLFESCQSALYDSAIRTSTSGMIGMQSAIGDEISYLFLGNAYLQLAYAAYPDKVSVTKFLSLANESFEAGRMLAPQNLRYTVGLGQSRFEKARVNQNDYRWYNPAYCQGIDMDSLTSAKADFESTLERIKAISAEREMTDSIRYAEAIAQIGLGRISAWQYCESDSRYEDAMNHLQKVIDLQIKFPSIALIRPAMYAELELATLLARRAVSEGMTDDEAKKLVIQANEHAQNAYKLTQNEHLPSFSRDLLLTKLLEDKRFCIIASSEKSESKFSQICNKE